MDISLLVNFYLSFNLVSNIYTSADLQMACLSFLCYIISYKVTLELNVLIGHVTLLGYVLGGFFVLVEVKVTLNSLMLNNILLKSAA